MYVAEIGRPVGHAAHQIFDAVPFAHPADKSDNAFTVQTKTRTHRVTGIAPTVETLRIDAVTHHHDSLGLDTHVDQDLFQRGRDRNNDRRVIADPTLGAARQSAELLLTEVRLLHRQRAVHFEDDRDLQHTRNQHAGEIEQRVTFVDEIGLDAPRRRKQLEETHQVVADLGQLAEQVGQIVLQATQHRRLGIGVTGRRFGCITEHQRDLVHLVAAIPQAADDLADMDTLSVAGLGAVMVENTHVSLQCSVLPMTRSGRHNGCRPLCAFRGDRPPRLLSSPASGRPC